MALYCKINTIMGIGDNKYKKYLKLSGNIPIYI